MSSVSVNGKWVKVVPNEQLKALVNDVKTVLNGNRKGFTILEAMASVAILSIVLCASMSFFTGQIKVTKKLNTKLETATANANSACTVAINTALNNPAKKDKRVTFPILNECKAIVGNWYGKRTDTRVISLYKSSNCVASYIGTLTALSNPTYDDTETDTFWNVSGDGSTLRMFIMKENL
jgi:prepilin-type N-terminal cleavage/methylation domain-containing protein